MTASRSVALILLSIISILSVSAPPAAVAWPSKQHQGALQQQQERERNQQVQQQQRETEQRFRSRKQQLDNLNNNIPGSGLPVQPSYASPLFEPNSAYYNPNAEQEFFEEILRK